MPAHKFACLCCGSLTLDERGKWEVCPVCHWEDDPQLTEETTWILGIDRLRLLEARQSYLRMGTCDKEHDEFFKEYTRAPLPEEIP